MELFTVVTATLCVTTRLTEAYMLNNIWMVNIKVRSQCSAFVFTLLEVSNGAVHQFHIWNWANSFTYDTSNRQMGRRSSAQHTKVGKLLNNIYLTTSCVRDVECKSIDRLTL